MLQPQTICNGESAQVDAEIPSGTTYTWSPSTGVSDVNIPNPILSPNTTTTYTVTIEDECGEATIESVEITVTPQNTTTFDPIDPICEGDSNPLPTTDINGVTGSLESEPSMQRQRLQIIALPLILGNVPQRLRLFKSW